jgi:hypothetical protein
MYVVWENVRGVGECTWCGRMYVVWQNVRGVEECTWCGRMYVVWQNVRGAGECMWCGRMYVVWKNVRGVGEGVWHFRFFVVTEFVFPDETIQTVLQNFLFCLWRQQAKMSHRWLFPKLHGVSSQKIVIEMIYVTRVNGKVLHGLLHLQFSYISYSQ